MDTNVTTTPTISDLIARVPAFRQCPPQDLSRFLPHMCERKLAVGERLHELGAEAGDTFLVMSGAFELHDRSGPFAKVDRGFLGEEAAIGMDRYVSTAVAVEASTVLVMPREPFWSLAAHRAVRDQLLKSFRSRFTGRDEIGEEGSEDTATAVTATAHATISMRLVVGWIVALAAPVLILLTLRSSPYLPSPQAVELLATISAIVAMWIFRLVPDFVPALFAVLAVVILGLAPSAVAMSGFASDTFFMALSIFGLSAVITVSGLSYRVLLWMLKLGPAHKAWYSASLFISGFLLTPVVPTTNGRVAIVTPFLNELIGAIDKDSARREGPRLSASLLGGVSLMSAMFLSSKSVNFMIFGLLPPQEQARFQWIYWLYAASVCGAVLLALYGLGCWLLFRNPSRPSISRTVIGEQIKILGPLRGAEWAGVIGLVVLLASFLTASQHHIDVPWIALGILFALLMLGFLGQSDFRRQIDWNFLIFLGSFIGLIKAIKYVGLDKWLSQQLVWLGNYMDSNFAAFVLMLAAAIFAIRLVLPVNATVVIFVSILLPTAINLGVNPWLIGFLVLLLAEGFIWPYQTSYYLQMVSMARGESGATTPRVLILNAATFVMKVAAVYASMPFWRHLGIL